MQAPTPNFSHLLAMTGPYGIFEHADHTLARLEHGYCVDDVARVLLVVSRESDGSNELAELAELSLNFLAASQGPDGRCRNRRSSTGEWFGPSTNDDCWGRSLWALGTVMARSTSEDMRRRASRLFERGCATRSTWPRAMAFASLGAAEILGIDPDNRYAWGIINSAIQILDRPVVDRSWRWPEERLTYANAVLPEALLAAGSLSGSGRLVEAALDQLKWLLAMESSEGHLSVTPDGGRGPDDPIRRFDQQPIEVAAMADACDRALLVTNDPAWAVGIHRAIGWFLGENDLGAVMFDAASGGGYDGLTESGPNLNEGAESTVALLSTLQHARRFEGASL